MKVIERGTLILGEPWNEGRLGDDLRNVKRHRFDRRDDQGLAIALCGLRQEDRSNGWLLAEHFQDDFPICGECERLRP